MISKDVIDKIRESVDIVELIHEHVPDLKKAGKDYRGLCPFHKEKTPSFYVSIQKNIFYCFGCNTGGDVFKFIMKVENLTYPEAIKKLGKRIGIEIKESNDEEYSEKKVLYEILENAAKYYNKYLVNSDEGEKARRYLLKRKINQEIIEKYKLGYAPAGNKLFNSAKNKYKVELLLKSGVVSLSEKRKSPYDHLQDRIVFPIYDISENIIAFGGRVLDPEREPLYLNTSDTIIYNKSRSLYGLYQAVSYIRKTNKVIILEGYFDVLVTHQYNVNNTVAPLGTSLTQEQIKILKKVGAETMILVFDSDNSGRNAALRAGELCLENEINCIIVSLPEKVDPDEFIINNGPDKFNQLLETGVSPVEFKINMCREKYKIDRPEEKSALVRETLQTIAKIADPIIKHETIKLLAQKMNLSEDIVVAELHRMLNLKKIHLNKEPALDSVILKLRSLEEEIIYLCLKHNYLCHSISYEIFSDERCSKSFALLLQIAENKINFAQMLDLLDPDIASWITHLSFEQREYARPVEQELDVYLKELEMKKHEEKRKVLEKEVILMSDGKIPLDQSKINEYNELTRQLKGSRNIIRGGV